MVLIEDLKIAVEALTYGNTYDRACALVEAAKRLVESLQKRDVPVMSR